MDQFRPAHFVYDLIALVQRDGWIGQEAVQRSVPKRPPVKVGLDPIGKATPMTLPCGVPGGS